MNYNWTCLKNFNNIGSTASVSNNPIEDIDGAIITIETSPDTYFCDLFGQVGGNFTFESGPSSQGFPSGTLNVTLDGSGLSEFRLKIGDSGRINPQNFDQWTFIRGSAI
jgi:hypothetical protein